MNPEPARELPGASRPLASGTAVPQLSADQFDRMTAYGVAQPVEVGDIVVRPGDVDYDLILVESGWIEILSPAIGDEPESVVARYVSGGFLGELNFLTGQTAYLMARVSAAGRIHRISRGRFRRLMATEPDLSDI
jgi:thioredoxin reductase (NADPH)